jgi:hypothetical protein
LRLVGVCSRLSKKPGPLEEHGSVVGERRQQGDLIGMERGFETFRDEQRPDHVVAGDERDTERGHDTFGAEGVIGASVVRKAQVEVVAGGAVRTTVGGDVPRHSPPGLDANALQLGRHRPGRRPDHEFARVGIDFREPGEVGLQQAVRATDQAFEEQREIVLFGELTTAGEQRGEFVPPTPRATRSQRRRCTLAVIPASDAWPRCASSRSSCRSADCVPSSSRSDPRSRSTMVAGRRSAARGGVTWPCS